MLKLRNLFRILNCELEILQINFPTQGNLLLGPKHTVPKQIWQRCFTFDVKLIKKLATHILKFSFIYYTAKIIIWRL